jgi:FkbM family methyltransferase
MLGNRMPHCNSVLAIVPLRWLSPFRRGVVTLRRGSFLRNICVAALKPFAQARSHLGRLKEVTPLDRPDLKFSAVDSMVIDDVYWFGIQGYEGIGAEVWGRLCSRARRILEIGGNVGLFTVVGARATAGSYTVVEPVPNVAAILRKNLELNRITSVELVEGAVVPFETSRSVKLNIPSEGRDAPVGAHLIDNVEIARRNSERVIEVRGIACAQLAQNCDLIKIDAEGIEVELLKSIRHMLVADKPSLFVEVLPDASELGAFLSALAIEAHYLIHVLPAYGSEQIVIVPAEEFSSELPQRFHSKDVVLSVSRIANTFGGSRKQ